MISVTLSTCTEDKPAPIVSDSLIATKAMAIKRAEQELADHIMIVKRRTLDMPLVVYEIGSFQPFSFSKLQIDGIHKIESWSLSVSAKTIKTSVTLVQAEAMCNG